MPLSVYLETQILLIFQMFYFYLGEGSPHHFDGPFVRISTNVTCESGLAIIYSGTSLRRLTPETRLVTFPRSSASQQGKK